MCVVTGACRFALFGMLMGLAGLTAADPAAKPFVPSAQELHEAYQRAQRGGQPSGRVYKDRLTPHWFDSNARFWYRNDLRGGVREFILVDAEKGTRAAAFDHEKLAGSLAKASGMIVDAKRLPFDSIEYIEGANAIQFKLGSTTWKCDLGSYECSKQESAGKDQEAGDRIQAEAARCADAFQDNNLLGPPWVESESVEAEAPAPQQRRPGQGRGEPIPSPRSPDGKWTAVVKDHNIHLRSSEGREVQLSQDGKEGQAYGMPQWSPDSQRLVAFRIEPGENKEVHLIESSPRDGGRARLQSRPYSLPGDRFTSYELRLFDVANQKEVKAEVDKIDFGRPRVRWHKDGRHFTYQKVDRGHQRFRLIEVDAHNGKARNLIDEKTETFIWTAHAENVSLSFVNYLERTDEIIQVSESDGWRHLYLIDAKEARLKNQITKGTYVVRGIDRIDEEAGQIWFRASGKHADQDPYFIHYYRVNFDGTRLVALTDGNGNHSVQLSPDRKFLIDTYSRVDLPPVHELRRTEDGKRLCELETADVSELRENGWEPPEVFVAKGRDARTDIWGIICRPRKVDPTKKYPVIEQIYAGPQGSFVPKTFSAARRFASLTELGFIVVQMDGMGTANRSKAFHDVCWHNLKDAGFPDRILWHKAAAEKYPYYDTGRVGIYGTSAGGQNATGALLFHGDFYKAAVSACGCHDNRMDKASWNEQWMGYPVSPCYASCSNIDNAARLRGKLFLIVGEMDTNVPPESTMRLADALIKAGKDFDLLVMPGVGHSNGGAYGTRRTQDFFVRHLHGVEPPERNATQSRTGG